MEIRKNVARIGRLLQITLLGGEMAEWFKAHAWKACVGNTTVGSNPSLSASFDPALPDMKAILFFLIAASLMTSSLFAKELSLRERRLRPKTKFQIDKEVINADSIDKIVLNKKLESKTQVSSPSKSKTLRADILNKRPVLTPVAAPKKRKNTHIHEWP